MSPRLPTALATALASAFLVAGCESYPQLDAVVSDEAWASDYPALVPTEQLRAAAAPRGPRATTLGAAAQPPAAQIDARAARLRARAAGLRGAVLDEADKSRLNTPVAAEDEET